MNKRESFLNTLNKFTQNFNALYRDDCFLDEKINNKEYIQNEMKWNCIFHNLDIALIKDITLNHNNAFEYFYSLDEEIHIEFLTLLSRTALGLIFFEKYSAHYQSLSTQDKKLIPKKISSIITYIKSKKIETENDKKIIGYLEVEYETLNNKHFTKNQLFQNLFYNLNILVCKIEERQIKNNPTTNSIKIINALLKEYFEYEKKYSQKTNFNNYTKYLYYWETQEPLILYHSK